MSGIFDSIVGFCKENPNLTAFAAGGIGFLIGGPVGSIAASGLVGGALASSQGGSFWGGAMNGAMNGWMAGGPASFIAKKIATQAITATAKTGATAAAKGGAMAGMKASLAMGRTTAVNRGSTVGVKAWSPAGMMASAGARGRGWLGLGLSPRQRIVGGVTAGALSFGASKFLGGPELQGGANKLVYGPIETIDISKPLGVSTV